MTQIRVLRVLEYIYDDVEKMAEDMARWTSTISVPRMTMRSASMPVDLLFGEPDESH